MSVRTPIYLDSSVWLSYLLKDGNEAKAVKTLERLDRGNDKGIVSTLVILEILDVMRKRITEKESYQGESSSTRGQIKSKVDTKTREFMDKITKLAKQGKAAIVDPNKALGEFVTDALKLHSPHFGEIVTQAYCPVCRGSFGPKYKYRGPGHWDIQHALNAKYTSANEIISLDGDFEQLKAIKDFSSLTITVL